MSTTTVTKDVWVEMFRAIGLDDGAMHRWHQEFERRAPSGHQSFLEWLQIPAEEIERIRAHSRKA
jgi:hypothetical protein